MMLCTSKGHISLNMPAHFQAFASQFSGNCNKFATNVGPVFKLHYKNEAVLFNDTLVTFFLSASLKIISVNPLGQIRK